MTLLSAEKRSSLTILMGALWDGIILMFASVTLSF